MKVDVFFGEGEVNGYTGCVLFVSLRAFNILLTWRKSNKPIEPATLPDAHELRALFWWLVWKD